MRSSRLFPLLTIVGSSLFIEACSCREDPIHLIEETPEDPHDIGQYLSMGVLDGAPVVSYYDRTKGALAFSVGTIGDDGVSWEEERVAGYAGDDGLDPGDVGKYTSLEVADDGTVWVSFFDATNNTLQYAQRNDVDDWEVALADKGSGPTPAAGKFSSLQLDGSDPVVAHYDEGYGQLRLATWNGSGFTGEVIDEGEDFVSDDTGIESADANVGQYSKLLIDGGTQYIAYFDAAYGDLKLATNTGGGWTITVIDDGIDEVTGEEAIVGHWPSMLVDGGELVITYQDFTNQDLRIARGSGENWSTELVDAGEWRGADSELFMNGSYPAIVYFDGNNNDVRLATNDGSAWSLDTLAGDEAGLGFHNETVEIGGQRYVACYDYTNRTIWFAKL
ncbi:MAG: hypothetical protein GY913_13145 [Proteobacteria bacterium]|nr:hypothetical protein [Pseudomonadota bacterium]MCP4917853.1 hypothetical protein [Pseudomonadota bacterium]